MTDLHSRLEELYSESSGLALAKLSLATILSSRSLATNTQSTGSRWTTTSDQGSGPLGMGHWLVRKVRT